MLSASLSPYRASTPAADRAVGAVMAAIDSLAAADRLLALRSIACLVGSRRAATVLAARNQGMSWAEIADRLGMSRQAVWHRFGPEEADQPPSDKPLTAQRRSTRRPYSSCASYKAVTTRLAEEIPR